MNYNQIFLRDVPVGVMTFRLMLCPCVRDGKTRTFIFCCAMYGQMKVTHIFDLLLMLDVFEHVEDYIGLLRAVRSKAKQKLFHIPLDLSVQSVLRRDGLLFAAIITHICTISRRKQPYVPLRMLVTQLSTTSTLHGASNWGVCFSRRLQGYRGALFRRFPRLGCARAWWIQSDGVG